MKRKEGQRSTGSQPERRSAEPDRLEERPLAPIIVLLGILGALFLFRRAAENLVAGGPPPVEQAVQPVAPR